MLSFALSFVLWALLHSVTAANTPKTWIRHKFGTSAYNGLYRLLYNLFSAVTFLPVLIILATRVPKTVFWDFPSPYNYAARLLQLCGLIGLLVSLWQTDIWDFAGFRQAVRYIKGQRGPTASAPLVTKGPYALVRHPLYFFSLLVIWFNPTVMLSSLAFNLLATLYFWLGSFHEERRLTALFGQEYEEYRKRVPFLLPLRVSK